MLITKLKSSAPADTLIVTSIQKMSNIKEDGCDNVKDIEIINQKRLVFIVDECHRSTLGDMLSTIKATVKEIGSKDFSLPLIQFTTILISYGQV